MSAPQAPTVPPTPASEIPPSGRPPWWIGPALSLFRRHFVDGFRTGARWRDVLESAEAYLGGMMAPGERKSMQPMGSRVGHSGDRFQHFVTESPWDEREGQLRIIRLMAPRFGTPHGLIALDDSEFPKQGKESAAVQPQYCGVLGKVANCQAAVSAQYVALDPSYNPDLTSFPLGMDLYLSEEWAKDDERRKKAWIPPEVGYRPKWRMGLDLVGRARQEKVPHLATTADAGYGTIPEFRKQLRAWKEPYAVGVQPENTYVRRPGETGNPLTCAALAKRLPSSAWKEMIWSAGTKGPLTLEVARVRVEVFQKGKATGEEVVLLFERRTNETKAYLLWGLDRLSLKQQVRVVRGRWPIEQSYREMKDELGLDQFEGRKWPGWYHHVTMALIAFALLMWVRADEAKAAVEEGRQPRRMPTLPKVKKFVASLMMKEIADRIARSEDPQLRRRLLIHVSHLAGLPLEVRDGELYAPHTWEMSDDEAPPNWGDGG